MNNKFKRMFLAIVYMVICMVATKIISEVVGPYSKNMYVNSCISELVLAVLAIIGLVLFKRTSVLKLTAEGFKEGILTGAVILVIGVCAYITICFERMTVSASVFEIMIFAVHMLLIGIAEEVLFRGIVQNAVMECIGTDSIGKVRAGIVTASVLFASVHLLNTFLPGVGFRDALRQAILVIPMGVLLGTIYFRSHYNIWPGILLHAFNDFCSLALLGYLSNVTLGDAILGTSNNIVASLLVFTIIDVWILRKEKLKKCISAE